MSPATPTPGAIPPSRPGSPHGYRERAVQAVTWNVSGQLATQAVRFAFGIALARLLSPREFGLIAMVIVLTQFLTSIADLGFEDALVQRRDLDEGHLSSVFWAMLAGGGVLTLCTSIAAPWMAAFYGVSELRFLAGLVSLLFVLSAIGTVPRALLVRRLDFRRSVQIECLAEAAAGIAAVALALRGFGAVSLAAQLLVGAGFESLLLLRASGWRPQLKFRPAAIGDLLGFSTYRLATQVLGYWGQHFDELLVGRFLGVAPLGLYARAYNLIRIPVLHVSRAIARVMFPSLSLIHDDAGRVRDVYLRTTGAVALATFPMSMGLFACAEPFVIGVLGPQWREAVPFVRILSAAGLLQSITTLSSSLYLSQGRADLHFRLNALQNLSTIVAVAIGVRWGVTGVAVAYVVSTALTTLPILHFAGRLVDLRPASVLRQTMPVFLAALTMTLVLLGLGAWARPGLSALQLLALEVVSGSLVYGGAIRLFRVQPYLDVLDVLRRPPAPPAPGR